MAILGIQIGESERMSQFMCADESPRTSGVIYHVIRKEADVKSRYQLVADLDGATKIARLRSMRSVAQ